MAKTHIKKGDTVKVIAGNEKGKTGVVKQILVEDNRAIIEGLNIVTKHKKPSAQNPNGGIVKEEAPIHLSNVMFMDAKSGETTRVGRKLNDKNKLQRYSKKTGDLI